MPDLPKEFDYRSLTPAIQQIPPKPKFLQDMIFKQRNSNPSQYVEVDVIVGGKYSFIRFFA